MAIFYLIAFALLGLAAGSFLSVCIDRLARNRSIVGPPSHCEACQHKLAVKDLIPVLSYLWLRGRCRYCHASISMRSLWVELATAAIFASLYWRSGLTPELGVMIFYSCLFMTILVIDLEHGLILNKLSYPGMAIALMIAAFVPQYWLTQWLFSGIANAALGGATGFAIFFLLAALSRSGMGWGDVKLAALIGFATGFPFVFIALMVGAILGGLPALALLISKRKGRKDTIPFGPFLSLAAMITLLWGKEILNWYLALI